MLGTRGVRLGVLKPGLYAMQVRALMEAAVDRAAAGGNPIVEIMIPLTVTREELALARGWVEEADRRGRRRRRRQGEPRRHHRHDDRDAPGRAAGRRDRRGGRLLLLRHQRPHPDDLRVQPGRRRGPDDARLPRAGPARSATRSRPSTRAGWASWCASASSGAARPSPELKLGVCGEHGGDPESIALFYDVGLDYVSCSPFRVPIARLAAAQAILGAGVGRHPLSPDPPAHDRDRAHRRSAGGVRGLRRELRRLRRPRRGSGPPSSAFITLLLVADLLLVHRTAHVISLKEAAIESAIWISHRPVVHRVVVLVGGTGRQAAGEYVSGYLIEKSLVVDNVFVWAVIISYFAVPAGVPVPGAVLGHLRGARAAGRRSSSPASALTRPVRVDALRVRRLPALHGVAARAPRRARRSTPRTTSCCGSSAR